MITTAFSDPKGYYTVLGLTPGADLPAIKAAYRSRVKKVHPDHNPSEAARLEFQRLAEAYHVLCDGLRRAEYDATGGHPLTEDSDDIPATPLACGCCGQITAQPRYVVFHQVKSYLVWARWRRTEGIFCRRCADMTAARLSTACWTGGWWSPPGLVLTPLALLRNLMGGTKPRDQNARLLLRQGRAFMAQGDIALAHALAAQAARFARLSVHKRQVAMLLQATAGEHRRLRDRWAPWLGGVFWAQALPLVSLPVVVSVVTLGLTAPWNQPIGSSAEITLEPAQVGDIRHVAVQDLKLRQAPTEKAPVLTILDRFTVVQILDSPDPEWAQVRTPSGTVGWVGRRGLYAGAGNSHKRDWCEANRGGRPEAGEALLRRASGEHRLMVHNEGRHDAVVKLKTMSGTTVVSYFVPATFHLAVTGIPEGTFRIEYATGSGYSRACGLFTSGMEAALLPFTVTFRTLAGTQPAAVAMPQVTLTAPTTTPNAGAPQRLSADRFGKDE